MRATRVSTLVAARHAAVILAASVLACRGTHAPSLRAAASRDVAVAISLYGGRVAWPRDGMPIPLWIQPPPRRVLVGAGDPAHHTGAVLRAAEAWRGAAPGVWFDVVDDSAGALVHVVWRRTLAQRAPARPLVGRTTLALAAGTRPVAALVELALWADDARGYAPLDVERAAVHELGHVLGLAHVRDGTSIMADPPRAMRPSARDRLALRELRHGVPHAGSPPPPAGVLEPVAWRSDAPHPRLHR